MSFNAVNVDSSMPYALAFSYVSSSMGPASMACFFLYSGESGLSSGRCPGTGGTACPLFIACLLFIASAAVSPFGFAAAAAPFCIGARIGVTIVGCPVGVSDGE